MPSNLVEEILEPTVDQGSEDVDAGGTNKSQYSTAFNLKTINSNTWDMHPLFEDFEQFRPAGSILDYSLVPGELPTGLCPMEDEPDEARSEKNITNTTFAHFKLPTSTISHLADSIFDAEDEEPESLSKLF